MTGPVIKIHEESRVVNVPATQLRVAGITSFTTIDFPGKLSAVAFLQGCPWRCVFCHNPWMQPREFSPELMHSSWEALEQLLDRRHGLLDGVVFSGGEPCLDPALPDAIARVKDKGYAVGLHTAGAYPRRLKEVIGMLDWVGLDVKGAPGQPDAFDKIAGVPHACEHFIESFETIKDAQVSLECRTTAHPDYLPDSALRETAQWLVERGVDTFALQIYRKPNGALFSPFACVGTDYPSSETMQWLKGVFPHFIERRADR